MSVWDWLGRRLAGRVPLPPLGTLPPGPWAAAMFQPTDPLGLPDPDEKPAQRMDRLTRETVLLESLSEHPGWPSYTKLLQHYYTQQVTMLLSKPLGAITEGEVGGMQGACKAFDTAIHLPAERVRVLRSLIDQARVQQVEEADADLMR